MSRKETRRSHNLSLREQATSWRQQPEEDINLGGKQVNPQQFRKTNIHLISKTKINSKSSSNDPIWDESGCLIKQPNNMKSGRSLSYLKRSSSVASFHPNIYQQLAKEKKEKPPMDTKTTTHTIKFIETEKKPIIYSKVTKKGQLDSIIRLTTRKIPNREKSVQPRRPSTDFEGFINRQTKCVKMHNTKPDPPELYKIEYSEGTKKVLQTSQKISTHSVYDMKKKGDLNDDHVENYISENNNGQVRPKMLRRGSGRLQNMDYDLEKVMREDKLKILAGSIQIAEGSLKLPNREQGKQHETKRQAIDEPYVPKRYRPNSVFTARTKIQAKLDEMRPIIDADEDEIKWQAEAKKNQKKKKNYLPSYIKIINDVVKPDWDDPKRTERRDSVDKMGRNNQNRYKSVERKHK